MTADKLRSYVLAGSSVVHGWFARTDAEIFQSILTVQLEKKLQGSVAEIGVHHGRSFIAMCLGLAEGERAYCIDVFENQHLNQDASGQGNREIFEQNLSRFGINSANLVIDSRSSAEVTAGEMLEAVGPIRFFSIDGGHWLEIVQNDLRLAENCIEEYGVIAMDDFHRPEWPDVSAGYFAWFAQRKKKIVPFAIGFNKLYLCSENWVDLYRTALFQNEFLRAFYTKNVKFQGFEVPVFQQYIVPEIRMRDRILAYLRIFHPNIYVRIRRNMRSARAKLAERFNPISKN